MPSAWRPSLLLALARELLERVGGVGALLARRRDHPRLLAQDLRLDVLGRLLQHLVGLGERVLGLAEIEQRVARAAAAAGRPRSSTRDRAPSPAAPRRAAARRRRAGPSDRPRPWSCRTTRSRARAFAVSARLPGRVVRPRDARPEPRLVRRLARRRLAERLGRLRDSPRCPCSRARARGSGTRRRAGRGSCRA